MPCKLSLVGVERTERGLSKQGPDIIEGKNLIVYLGVNFHLQKITALFGTGKSWKWRGGQIGT